jgi:hypothetical protein
MIKFPAEKRKDTMTVASRRLLSPALEAITIVVHSI